MKQTSTASLLLLFSACLLFACSASRNQMHSAIGLVPLSNYETVNDDLAEDTAYHVFQNDASFAAVVRATAGDAKKPSFNGQMAVAMLTKLPSLLQFERAEFTGNRIHVYLQSCSTSQPGCSTSKLFLATVPRVGNARSVQFFVNNEPKAPINL
jgi:hypothetical protein